eukprot:scaffold90657_cov31-Tisochrysis_lutea.AAC.2
MTKEAAGKDHSQEMEEIQSAFCSQVDPTSSVSVERCKAALARRPRTDSRMIVRWHALTL